MQCSNKINDRQFKFNSRLYKNIRLKFSATRRQKWKDMPKEAKDKFRQTMSNATKGANNGMYGKKLSDLMDKDKYIAMRKKQALTMKSLIYIVNLETKKTKRIPKTMQIPSGWIKGRTIKIS